MLKIIKFVPNLFPNSSRSFGTNPYKHWHKNSRNCLSNCPLVNHINSALDIFNVRCNVDELMPEIELVLKIKYNLKIAKNNPLKLIEVV